MRPDDEIPAGLPASAVLSAVLRHPWRFVGRRWNYKSAITSAMFRSVLFLAANLPAGLPAAVDAMSSEFVFRAVTSGYYGALTQAFRRVEPARAGLAVAMVALPLVGHSLELAMHWLRGTPRLGASIGASVAFTAVSTAFNLYAMRRGALIVGAGAQPLWRDLAALPSLFAAFLLSWRSRPSI